MLYFTVKIVISAVVIALISEIGKRSPAFAALVASLPLVSVLGMIWLWRDTGDTERLARHSVATFWYVIPSLPMFLVIPALIRSGVHFYAALALGMALTVVLYFATAALLARFGIHL